MAKALSKQEKQWQAETDAHTLMQAEVVEANKARLNAALKEVKKMNKVKETELKAGKKLVKAKTTKKRTTKKSTPKRRRK